MANAFVAAYRPGLIDDERNVISTRPTPPPPRQTSDPKPLLTWKRAIVVIGVCILVVAGVVFWRERLVPSDAQMVRDDVAGIVDLSAQSDETLDELGNDVCTDGRQAAYVVGYFRQEFDLTQHDAEQVVSSFESVYCPDQG